MKNKEERKKSKTLSPIMQIGKSGLSETVIDEIKRQLRQKRLIKIKLLKSSLGEKDRKTIAKKVAEKVDAEYVDLIGYMLTLKKK